MSIINNNYFNIKINLFTLFTGKILKNFISDTIFQK
jgi:hypothetical protein